MDPQKMKRVIDDVRAGMAMAEAVRPTVDKAVKFGSSVALEVSRAGGVRRYIEREGPGLLEALLDGRVTVAPPRKRHEGTVIDVEFTENPRRR
jgi:hypothetical protein